MNVYQIWCNLKPGIRDTEFVERVDRYLGRLRDEGRIEGHRVLRAKLGLRPDALREFLITIEVRDLAQLDAAFEAVASRTDPIEGLHHAVNAHVSDVMFALYRDFPDPVRVHGQERF
jgi:hypothetical protein